MVLFTEHAKPCWVLTILHSSAGTERVFSYLLTRIKMRVQIEMSSVLTENLKDQSQRKNVTYTSPIKNYCEMQGKQQ